MEMWSPYASMYNNPIRYSDLLGDSSIAPTNGLVSKVPNKDGDQKGIITNATQEQREQNPIGAAIQDISHAGLTIMGWNAIDNFIANRFNPENNSALQIVEEAAVVGLATVRGGKGEAGEIGEITEIIIDGSKHPEAAQHAQDAMNSGIPGEGIIDRAGASSRRRQNIKDVATESGQR